MRVRRIVPVLMLVFGLAGCVRSSSSAPPQATAESEPAADSAAVAVRTPDIDRSPSEPELEPEPEAPAELDPSLIAPLLPDDRATTLTWERDESASTKGKPAMELRATMLRGVAPDRVRGMRVTVSSRGAEYQDGAKTSFESVRLSVAAAPGIRFVGGSGMSLSPERTGAFAKFKSAGVGVRRDFEILFVADEGMVGKHPIATVTLDYVRHDRSREAKSEKKKSKKKEVSATLRR